MVLHVFMYFVFLPKIVFYYEKLYYRISLVYRAKYSEDFNICERTNFGLKMMQDLSEESIHCILVMGHVI